MIILDNIVSILPGAQSTDTGITNEGLIIGMNKTEFGLSLYFIFLLLITDYFTKDRGIENVSTTMIIPLRWVYSWFLLANLMLLRPSDTGAFTYFQF